MPKEKVTLILKDLVWPAAIVIALVVFYGFLFLLVGSKNFVQLIDGLAWPTVVVIALVVLRRPLSYFLSGIAQRATKLSITSFFAIELSLPEASHPGQVLTELQEFASGLTSAGGPSLAPYLYSLFQDNNTLDYMVIDLGSGQQWLTSRLFIFALMLERMRGLRYVVFLETRANVPRNFLGTASPNKIRWALAYQYPWLERAYITAQAQLQQVPPIESKQVQSRQGTLSPDTASALVGAFLNEIQSHNARQSPPAPQDEWEFILNGPYWERGRWIDEDRLKTDLGDALRKDEENAWFEDSPDISRVERAQAILRRKGPFVALVDKERVFKKLIDREALLEQVAEHVGAVSDGQ